MIVQFSITTNGKEKEENDDKMGGYTTVRTETFSSLPCSSDDSNCIQSISIPSSSTIPTIEISEQFELPSVKIWQQSNPKQSSIQTAPKFKFKVRQNPIKGLYSGIDDCMARKNARLYPLDPPPICELMICWEKEKENGNNDSKVNYLSIAEVYVHCRLVKVNEPFEEERYQEYKGSRLIGNLVESGFIAPCSTPFTKEECFFIFSELTVQRNRLGMGTKYASDEGKYRLRFDLIDRANLNFKRISTVFSQPFLMFESKQSLGDPIESSDLVKSIVQRGLRLRLIRPKEDKKSTTVQSNQVTINDGKGKRKREEMESKKGSLLDNENKGQSAQKGRSPRSNLNEMSANKTGPSSISFYPAGKAGDSSQDNLSLPWRRQSNDHQATAIRMVPKTKTNFESYRFNPLELPFKESFNFSSINRPVLSTPYDSRKRSPFVPIPSYLPTQSVRKSFSAPLPFISDNRNKRENEPEERITLPPLRSLFLPFPTINGFPKPFFGI